MSELRSILLAIEHATIRRDAMAKVAVKLERNLQFARQQLQQLSGYAGDTDARWEASVAREISVEILRHQYQFMGRLQQAIQMQHGVIAGAERQLEAAKGSLLQAELRLSGLNQILKVRKVRLVHIQDVREQRQTDEFAAMLHSRNRTSPMSGENYDR